MEQLVIKARQSVGPLEFGMTQVAVNTLLGTPQNRFSTGGSDGVCEVWEGVAFSSCDFTRGHLEALTINHGFAKSVLLGDVDLLQQPLDQVLAALDKMNGGTDQIQGGSLAYERLGLVLSQFEDAGARELCVTSKSIAAVEATRPVGLQGALAYYRAQKGADPADDVFGRGP